MFRRRYRTCGQDVDRHRAWPTLYLLQLWDGRRNSKVGLAEDTMKGVYKGKETGRRTSCYNDLRPIKALSILCLSAGSLCASSFAFSKWKRAFSFLLRLVKYIPKL